MTSRDTAWVASICRNCGRYEDGHNVCPTCGGDGTVLSLRVGVLSHRVECKQCSGVGRLCADGTPFEPVDEGDDQDDEID